MIFTPEVVTAQSRVEAAALRAIAAERYTPDEDPNADAMRDYADDELALAARDLTRAVEAMPAADRPVGWGEKREEATA